MADILSLPRVHITSRSVGRGFCTIGAAGFNIDMMQVARWATAVAPHALPDEAKIATIFKPLYPWRKNSDAVEHFILGRAKFHPTYQGKETTEDCATFSGVILTKDDFARIEHMPHRLLPFLPHPEHLLSSEIPKKMRENLVIDLKELAPLNHTVPDTGRGYTLIDTRHWQGESDPKGWSVEEKIIGEYTELQPLEYRPYQWSTGTHPVLDENFQNNYWVASPNSDLIRNKRGLAGHELYMPPPLPTKAEGVMAEKAAKDGAQKK